MAHSFAHILICYTIYIPYEGGGMLKENKTYEVTESHPSNNQQQPITKTFKMQKVEIDNNEQWQAAAAGTRTATGLSLSLSLSA